MAREAERLLEGTGWLPEPLRATEVEEASGDPAPTGESEALPDFLDEDEQGGEEPSSLQAASLAAAE